MCVVARIQEIYKEFRFFVIDKKFDYPGYVIDIADTKRGYKIVELNCLNASGLYEIDLYKLVQAVDNFYVKRYIEKLKR